MDTENKQIYYNDDGAIDMSNSCYFDYECFNDSIRTWKIPKYERLLLVHYILQMILNFQVVRKKRSEYIGFVSLIFRITFEDLQKQQVDDTSQPPVHGVILCNEINLMKLI